MKIILAFSLLLVSRTTCLSPPATTKVGSNRREILKQTVALLSTTSVLLGPVLPAVATEGGVDVGGKIVYGNEKIMAQKAHGTSESPVQSDLLYGVSNKLADSISNYNRQFAERAGYFQSTSFEETLLKSVETKKPVTFYDSVTGKPLFVAPIGRSVDEFVQESKIHGWPSFRDEEVVWDNVRVLKPSGETVSFTGTHLGHNLPDRNGNRYCINLVSIAGQPIA